MQISTWIPEIWELALSRKNVFLNDFGFNERNNAGKGNKRGNGICVFCFVCTKFAFSFVSQNMLNSFCPVLKKTSYHVHRELPDVAVELAREAEAARDARQTRAHQVVQVAVRRRRQLKRAEANVVQSPGDNLQNRRNDDTSPSWNL